MPTLSGTFGFVPALLAMIGLCGVVSYLVVTRQSEIGVRLALGADRSQVIGLVMRDVWRLLLIGATIGTILALFA